MCGESTPQRRTVVRAGQRVPQAKAKDPSEGMAPLAYLLAAVLLVLAFVVSDVFGRR